MNDISLYIPWNIFSEMEKELNTMARIHKNNMYEIYELRDSIKKLPIFDMLYAIKTEQCSDANKQYVDEKNKNLGLFEQHSSEYNSLLKQESRLLQEIKEYEISSNKLTETLQEVQNKQKEAKKLYHSQKSALNLAKRVYESNFGLEVAIQDHCNGILKAKVIFHNITDFFIELTIDKMSSTILDFNTSSITQEEINALRIQFEQTTNALTFIASLRNFTMHRLIM